MEYDYKDIERAALHELECAVRIEDIGKTTGHHKKLKIGNASVPTDERMDYPIFAVYDANDEIIGYYIHVGPIYIEPFSELRFDDDDTPVC